MGSPADVGHTNSPSEQEWDGQVSRVNEPGQTKDVERSENPETKVTLRTPRSESRVQLASKHTQR